MSKEQDARTARRERIAAMSKEDKLALVDEAKALTPPLTKPNSPVETMSEREWNSLSLRRQTELLRDSAADPVLAGLMDELLTLGVADQIDAFEKRKR